MLNENMQTLQYICTEKEQFLIILYTTYTMI